MSLNADLNKQEFLDLCPVYALGALEGEDLDLFRRALARADAEMKAALREALLTSEDLSLAAPEALPSPALKKRLMAQIRFESGPRTAAPVFAHGKTEPSWLKKLFPAAPRFGFAAACALLFLSIGLLGYVFSLHTHLSRTQIALGNSQAHIVALENSLSQKDAMLEVLRSKQMQVVILSGLDVNPSGYGKVLWDPEKKVAVLHVSLPPEPADKDYELWVIRDKKPVDAGLFQVHAGLQDGELYRIDHLVETDRAHINAFAVTLEPKGGMPQPTGKMYLLGNKFL